MKKYIQLLSAAIIVACNVISAQTNVGGTTPPPAGVNLEVSKPGTTKLDSIPTGIVTDQLLTVDTGGNVRRIAFSSLLATASQAVFSDDVFAGKATAPRKDDVLYNIIDSKTGGMLTYKKVILFANSQPLVDANVDSVLVRKLGNEYFMLTKDRLTVKDFGAKGDGSTDDFIALQKAINTATSWGRALYVPAGQYLYSHTLNLPNVTYVPNTVNPNYNYWFTLKMIGDGENSTELKHIGSNDTICIQALLGDGNAAAQGGLYDMMITGDANTTTALYVNGRCGLQTFNCKFVNHKIAVLLHNSYPGDYTEFVVQHNAFFTHCKTVLYYLVTNGGDQSFHGSGIDGGVAVVTDNYPIKIFNGIPYNAPLTLTMFLLNTTQPITVINNVGSAVANFYGHLSFENTNPKLYDPTVYNILQDGNFLVTYTGTISSLQPLLAGKLRQANAFEVGYGGFPALTAPQARTSKLVYPVNAQYLLQKVTYGNDSTSVHLVYATCTSQGFFYQALLALSDAENYNGTAKVVQVLSNTIPDGYNAPSFSFYAGLLILTGTKTDGTPWDRPVKIQYNILPMTESLITEPDPQHS